MQHFGDDRDWFFQKRYGLFLHWGLYSLGAWHEQEQWRRRIPRAEYVKLAQRWNPTAFDPDAWLDLMEDAGMEYIVLTTKHHDGFCLFRTAQTEFNVMNTPYGKDLVGQLAEACQRRNVPLGLYYSVVDWHQPHYPNQGRHHELPPQEGDVPDEARYVEFMREQVRELCTQYGPIGSFWWDLGDHIRDAKVPGAESVNALIHELQPGCVVNNRGLDGGDFGTPERDWDGDHQALLHYETPTEACQSVGSQSWGYREGESFYSDRHLLRGMARAFAKGGNYLLNVGPKADGTIPPESQDILRRLGSWVQKVRSAWTDVEPASALTDNRNVLLTRRGNDLYVFAVQDPECEDLLLPGLDLLPNSAVLLNTGASCTVLTDLLPSQHMEQQGCLRICGLPINELANQVLVIKLSFADLPETPQRKETVQAVHDDVDPNVM